MLAEDCSHRDEDSARAEIADNQGRDVQNDFVPFTLGVQGLMPEGGDEDSDLQGPGSDPVVEAHRCPAVRLEEDHEEAESDENHNVHVLENGVVLEHFVLSCKAIRAGTERSRVHALTVLGKEQVAHNHEDLAQKKDDLSKSRGLVHLKDR